MFAKVLIANRGAIACRVIRSLRHMGVASVAVYTQADLDSLHVRAADEAICIGAGPVADSYLDQGKILAAAKASGSEAIHPGYGFFAENADFAAACEAQGLVFLGPSPEQMRAFGLKHRARELAIANQVPLLPGSALLRDVEHAAQEALRIGYPVMLKSSAGGGGIGMRLVREPEHLADAYASVTRLASGQFGNASLFLEKYLDDARHIEVQIFGDGKGDVITLGERDCSAQRRNQKVLEEAPAGRLSAAQRSALHDTAKRLVAAVAYRSAGTVEFLVDARGGDFYFLEVNTRLQVEHGVTEAIFRIDLVQWMVRLGAGTLPPLSELVTAQEGVALQARLYAEDPGKNFQPSTGLLTEVIWPEAARVETWLETGSSVSAYYDPMLAKLIVHGADRPTALAALAAALDACHIGGIETNLDYLRDIVADPRFQEGRHTTALLATIDYRAARIDVLEPGLQTTVQDWPARLGYWAVGVPPSGPMDVYAHRIANRLVGNASDAAALECTIVGPTLRFRVPATIALTGAAVLATIDGRAAPMWQALQISAGSVLAIGRIGDAGCRVSLAIAGGLDVPTYLGSRATFMLGQFGGHAGRTLRQGDVLRLFDDKRVEQPGVMAPMLRPLMTRHWDIAVLYGPHGAPDFFLEEDIAALFATDWGVHHQSSRTGVRLIGPKPTWARRDGGEAGLHPSNIHDTAYAIGAIDFTGDMPVILGPDGPSLGGFVCPAVVIHAELWKLGQLRAGDTVRFHRVSLADALARERAFENTISYLSDALANDATDSANAHPSPIVAERAAKGSAPRVVYRQAGDHYILIEYGPEVLDLELRLRAHQMVSALHQAALSGLIDLTPGIRSLQVHFDPFVISQADLLAHLLRLEDELPALGDVVIPNRIVYLPLAFDDSSTRDAIERYSRSVRSDAPWCPSNLEFIRRINGLESIDALHRLFFSASYLVLGLGDVYLGAPVATPLDPRQRLVTTKYNPARTWTPENAVGIGGAYLCVYGMEGPGGYQFVGRTVQMWNRWRHGASGDEQFDKPWLLRAFDQLQFYPVSEEQLTRLRRDFPLGRAPVRIEQSEFRLADYRAFLSEQQEGIATFKHQQQAAFEAERERWRLAGTDVAIALGAAPELDDAFESLPEHARAVSAPLTGVVCKILVAEGDLVAANDVLAVIESIKMEFPVNAPVAGVVMRISCRLGQEVEAGQGMVVLEHQTNKAAA